MKNIGINEESVQSLRRKKLAILLLGGIIIIAAFLRFYQLGAVSVGNAYYAATVKSMLMSWHNFFFAAYEPGGSVSVDKPPLGFWLEAVSALLLGVNGFALALPNALAGVLSIPLLYSMVEKQFGLFAGLTAAMVLAVAPITIAAERNNTIDGLLVFVLLLAAWAIWRSVEIGKFRYLLLGAFLVGLGFNIKMLQAYMVLPALFSLYLFGAKHAWWKRIFHLSMATVLLLLVSLTWAFVVDAVPADSRPFIGSSTDNTVMELIVGHNGVKRLIGGGGVGIQQTAINPQSGGVGGFASATQGGQPGQPPIPPGGNGLGNRAGGSNEVGTAGIFRLFTEPLVSQGSWLMPLALLGLVLTLVVLGRHHRLTEKHLALILWAGWLIPIGLYFTFTTGLWHTYYLIMLGPALAALVGATVWAFERLYLRSVRLGWSAIALLSGITLVFENFIISSYPVYFAATSILMVSLWLVGLALLWVRPQSLAICLVLASLLIGPTLWSGLTTFNPQPEVNLPKAGPLSNQPGNNASEMELSPTQQKLLEYLLANTSSDAYLVATLDSHGASPFILATGRAVMTFGGFRGDDTVITVSQLQEMISSDKLRFVLDNGNLSSKQEIFSWVSSSCRIVNVPGLQQSTHTASQNLDGGPREQQFTALYDCSFSTGNRGAAWRDD